MWIDEALVERNTTDNLSGDKENSSGIDRRTFLKISAVDGAAVAASHFLPKVRQPAVATSQLTEGITSEKLVATSCLNCGTRCATLVRVVNGKAVKITGNPLSEVSEGEVCPRSHLGLQVLYDADRVSGPLKRSNPQKGKGVDPGWVPIPWNQALNEVAARLKSLREQSQPHKLLVFHGLNINSDEDMITRFASAFGTPNIASDEALKNEAERQGRWLADGNYAHIGYDLGQTNYVLAFGAGIVESEKPLARNLRMWGKIRRERPNRAKIVVIDPRYSVTAAKADTWLPINPGTDAALAMAIANVIISENLYNADFVQKWTSGFDKYQALVLSQYSPEKVAEITGIKAEMIQKIAREFAQTRPAIAWTGRGVAGWPNGTYTSYAIFCLNALVGSIDAPGGVIYQELPKFRDMPQLIEDDAARQGKAQPRLDIGKVGVLPPTETATNQIASALHDGKPYPVEVAIGFNSNFNMSAPGAPRWDEALKKLPYYIHVAPYLTEMAEYADIVLPSPSFMEAWGYEQAPPGSGFAELKLKQPVVALRYDTRDIADIIFEISRRLGESVAGAFNGIGDDVKGFVRFRTENMIPWSEFLDNGVWVDKGYPYGKYDRIFQTPSKKFEFYSSVLESKGNTGLTCLPHYEEPAFHGNKGTYSFTLVTYQPLLTVESGNQNYPWAQEILQVMHGAGWTNFVEINTKSADSLHIKDKDTVWVESPFGKIKATARVIEGIHPEVVAIASGQGHYTGGKWQNGIGVNPNEIIGVDYDRLSGQSAFFNTRVKVYKA